MADLLFVIFVVTVIQVQDRNETLEKLQFPKQASVSPVFKFYPGNVDEVKKTISTLDPFSPSDCLPWLVSFYLFLWCLRIGLSFFFQWSVCVSFSFARWWVNTINPNCTLFTNLYPLLTIHSTDLLR